MAYVYYTGSFLYNSSLQDGFTIYDGLKVDTKKIDIQTKIYR